MDENVDLPVAAPYGAFEFRGSNETRNKLRISIMKSSGRNEDQPRAPAFTLVLVLMISLLRPFSASATHFDNTSFDFPSFGSENLKLLNIRGKAFVLSPDLHLSQNQPNQSGQATYSKKVHLWDKATENEADFAARFKFSIDSQHRNAWGDGLTFFVAPQGSSMSGSLGGGGDLGLPEDSYVATEFDTFKNPWDINVPHVGIDLNDVRSVAYDTVPWLTDKIMNGGSVNASITYDSRGKNLSVVLMDADGNSSNYVSLHYAALGISDYLPEWVEVGFSAATGAAFEHHIVHSWEFNSSLRLRAEKATCSWWMWLLIVLGGVFGLVLIIIVSRVAWVYYKSKVARRHPSKKAPEVNNAPTAAEGIETETERGGEQGHYGMKLTADFKKLSGPTKFSYEELVIATDSFADDRILGRGGFGFVYEGHIGDDRTQVAVKMINSDSHQGIKEYISEVTSASQLRHRNLVQLIGYCHEENKFALVYEFMREGSLEDHLFKGKRLLTWETRYNIARGLASGLYYLHEQWNQCVIHRDIKSSNTMLNERFEAKLGDFGLARLVDHARGQKITQLKGTPGYLAPECFESDKTGKESDIYSFGVVLLEIACGRRAIQDQRNLVDWVREEYRLGKFPVDSKLGRRFNMDQAKALMSAGLWCAHPDVNLRPSIETAMAVLNLREDLSNFPSDLRVLMEGLV